jgi:ABC-type multidrug transport system ATPase subunit
MSDTTEQPATPAAGGTPAGGFGQVPGAPPPPPPIQLGAPSEVYETSGQRVTIGRAPENTIVLADLTVSANHAVLERASDGSYLITDLNSSNGTFVNGLRVVQRARVDEGSVISLGRHLLRFTRGTLEEYVESGQAYLEALNLTVTTEEGRVILSDVSFSLGPSSLLAIVGPSGAGKSTLTNALNGFRPASSGSVLYGGRDLYRHYDDIRQRIGFVPQDDILHPLLTVRRALEYAAELRFPTDTSKQERTQRIVEVLDELDLTERATTQIAKLSGGQRKRVSVALELLTKPSLLFLDEPTSGLDPGNERQVMALLQDLAKGGRTVIVVTHSTQSLHLCDRVLFMAPGGKVGFYGPPAEAIGFFKSEGAGDAYADVFSSLEERTDVDWGAGFRQSPQYQEFVGKPLEARAQTRVQDASRPAPPPRRQSWWKQFSILTRRYLRLIVADRRYLLLLILQAPVIGLLLFVMFDKGRLGVAHGAEALIIILTLVLAATWLGILNAVQEIVKELPIYRRERATGLSISAYLSSKVAVLGTFTIIQAIVMVGIGLAKQDVFRHVEDPTFLVADAPGATGVVFTNPKTEIIVGVALTGLAAMGLGLLVSAMSKTPEKALTIVPVLIVPQLVLSGGFFPVTAPVVGQLSLLTSAQWGMSTTSSTVDMNLTRGRLIFIAALAKHADLINTNPPLFRRLVRQEFQRQQIGLWKHQKSTWFLDAFMLLLLTGGSLFGAYYVLRRRDLRSLEAPARAGPGPPPAVGPGPPPVAPPPAPAAP